MTAPVSAASAPAGGTASTQTDSKKVRPIGSAYVILEERDDGYAVKSKVADGRDAEHALRKWSEANGNYAGTFIAIPAKSWKRLTVTPQTVTTLKLEEAK